VDEHSSGRGVRTGTTRIAEKKTEEGKHGHTIGIGDEQNVRERTLRVNKIL